MTIKVSVASFLCKDFVALWEFYQKTFDLVEIPEMHTPLFRAADLDGVMLGFSADSVYEILNMGEYRNATGTKQYLTFECDSDADVDALTARAVENGARVLHEPYETYYGSWQSVLADPEDNPFRLNHFR